MQDIFDAARRHGADFAEVYAERTEVQSLELMDGIVSQATHTLLQGIGVRELTGESTRYTYSMPSRMPDWFCPAEGRTVQLQPKTLLDMERLAYEQDPRVVKVKAVVASTITDVTIANTIGEVPVHDRRERYVLMVHVVLQQDGRHEMGFASQTIPVSRLLSVDSHESHSIDSSESHSFLHTFAEVGEAVVRRALAQADHLFYAITPQGGDMPVVMAAGASGILLHEAIGHAFEADFNRLGTSIFTDKMGQQICRPGISIVDDGTLPEASGTFAFDDEGAPSQCTYLVHDGRLESYLHDHISAKHYGVKPTGNGRRQSFRHAPVPRMTNTYMLAGEASEEDIIRSVKHGIYAQSFTNGQVQIGAGDFTFFLKTGFLIEDGHLTQPIRDVNIIGNGPHALADISMVGNNLMMDTSVGYCGKAGQQVPVGQGIPTVLVEHLNVGGVGQ